jgi:hypothetical protein
MPAAPQRSAAESRATGAVLGALVTIAAYKLYMIGLGHPLAWMTGLSIDVAVVGVLWVVAIRLLRTRRPATAALQWVLFWPLLALWFASSFAFTYFYADAGARHYSLLNVTMAEVRLFVRDLLPLTGWLWVLGLVAATVVLARWFAARIDVGHLRRPAVGTALIGGTACLLGWSVPDVPSPVMDILRDLRTRMTQVAVKPDAAGPAGDIALFDRSARARPVPRPKFDRIVVVVMETMPADTYREELAGVPPSRLLRTMDAHAHRFDRYYTPNQDSRTAMLDMLGARFIPYEAYDDVGVEIYRGITGLSNLPALLHQMGYATSYVLAQEDKEDVVADLPWQQVRALSKDEIASFKQTALCYHPYEFENSCEDKVVLGDVVRFLAEHPRAFVYQEMMWGHDLEYNRVSGKSNVQYVAEYVDSLWTELERRHLADGTLLVLTGDHGAKAEDRTQMAVNYQVPLYFYAKSLAPQVERGMYTHLDFQELLLRELDPSRPLPPTVPFVQVVGPTDSHLRIVVDSSGGVLGLTERGGQSYVAFSGPARTPDPARHQRMFEDYRRWFVGRVGTAVP